MSRANTSNKRKRKPKRAMKNGYSNGNAGHTRHRTNTNKKKPTENQKGEQHGPHQNPGCVNPDAREGL